MLFDPSCCSQILNKHESALIETDDYERGVKVNLMKDTVYYLPGMGGLALPDLVPTLKT
jgi:hypothetical protein